MMTELLHVGALGASAIGACCVSLEGPRPRVREIALSVVMVAAMLDVILGMHVLPVVGWSAALVALSIAVSVRRRRSAAAADRMRVYAGVGGVLSAALLLVMSAGAGESGHHGTSPLLLRLLLAAGVAAFVAGSLVHLRRGPRLRRLQFSSMAASVLLMSVASLA